MVPSAAAASRKQWLHVSWSQLPEETPVTQRHVADPDLLLATHGPAKNAIKKSRHSSVPDDPWYIWSGMCTEGHWAVSLRPARPGLDGAGADLRGGLAVARTYQTGRVLRLLLEVAPGRWVVSCDGYGDSGGWEVGTLELDLVRWQAVDIDTVEAKAGALGPGR